MRDEIIKSEFEILLKELIDNKATDGIQPQVYRGSSNKHTF